MVRASKDIVISAVEQAGLVTVRVIQQTPTRWFSVRKLIATLAITVLRVIGPYRVEIQADLEAHEKFIERKLRDA